MKFTLAIVAAFAGLAAAQYPPPGGVQQGGYARPCGFSCMINAIKSANCRPAQPPPPPEFGEEGPPEGWQPPRASQDQVRSTTQCFCQAGGLQQAVTGCAVQECQKTNGNIGGLIQQFNGMCAGVPGFAGLRG